MIFMGCCSFKWNVFSHHRKTKDPKQSRWQRFKKTVSTGLNALHKDSHVSNKGKEQMKNLYDNFAETLFKYDKYKSIFNEDEPNIFHFESSNLRRAQFTTMAAMKSLIDYSKTNSEISTKYPLISTNLDKSKYFIVQNLQEASAGFDAWSKFKTKYLDTKTKCKKWMEYLLEGYSNKKDDLWTEMFEQNDKFKERLCSNTGFIKAGWSNKNGGGHVINSLGKTKHDRIHEYGEYLHKLIKKGVKLIVVGGHSNWALYFVDIFIPKLPEGEIVKMWLKYGKALCEPFGKNYQKIPNGHMVDIVVQPDTDPNDGKDTIEIVSIEEIFPEVKQLYSVGTNEGMHITQIEGQQEGETTK